MSLFPDRIPLRDRFLWDVCLPVWLSGAGTCSACGRCKPRSSPLSLMESLLASPGIEALEAIARLSGEDKVRELANDRLRELDPALVRAIGLL